VKAAPEQMVWGSDWPHPTEKTDAKPDDAILFDLLADWAPDEAVRNRIRRRCIDSDGRADRRAGFARLASVRTTDRRAPRKSPLKSVVWISLSENLNICYRAFMSLQRCRRVWRRATGSLSQGEDKKFGKGLFWFFILVTLCNPTKPPKDSLEKLAENRPRFGNACKKAWRSADGPGRRWAVFATLAAPRGTGAPLVGKAGKFRSEFRRKTRGAQIRAQRVL
jgi:hypothetical protein